MKPKYKIGKSDINGKGIICTVKIEIQEFIAIGIKLKKGKVPNVSRMGRFVNHSDIPNAILLKQNGNYEVIARKIINPKDEITISYNDKFAPSIIKRYEH